MGGDLLSAELAELREAGVDAVASALRYEEIEEYKLAEEARICDELGMEFLAFPIRDRDVPLLSGAYLDFVRKVAELVSGGKAVAIHCRVGIGRSSIVAASAMILLGEPADAALARIEAARGRPVPDTLEQRQWLIEFEQKYLP